MVRLPPVAENPVLQVGVHEDPLVIDAGQAVEKIVEVVSEGRGQGFALHVPDGAERVPREQLMVSDAVAVKPDWQTGVHD